MKRFFIYTVVLAGFIALGWHYTPAQIRAKAQAFLGAAFSRDTKEIQKIAAETVLPENPAEKRIIILEDLKKNITAIKRQLPAKPTETATAKTNAKQGNKSSAAPSVQELVGSSEELIGKLEEANNDTSVTTTIADRILQTILPGANNAVCKSDK